MTRHDMIERIGNKYVTANIEGGEYSYVQEAGSKSALRMSLIKAYEALLLDITCPYIVQMLPKIA